MDNKPKSPKAKVLISLELIDAPENNKDIAVLSTTTIQGSAFECERMLAAAFKRHPKLLVLFSNALNYYENIHNLREITLPKDL